MRISSIYVFVLITIFQLKLIRGVDVCGKDKVAVNLVTAPINNVTLILSTSYQRSTCAWQITAPPGYIVRISLVGSIWSNDDCKNENLRIYNGVSSSDKLLAEFCPTKRKPRSLQYIYSTDENARMELKQGNSTTTRIVFTVEAVKKTQACKVMKLLASSTVSNFTSPNYPKPFPPNTTCSWLIEAPSGKYVKLRFSDLDIRLCGGDLLQVYDGDSDKSEDLIEKGCSFNNMISLLKRNKDIFSYGQKLYVIFKSVPTFGYGKKGFQALYSAIDGGKECSPSNPSDANNIVITSSAGKISSPGFPASIPADPFTCVWRLKAPEGQVIKVDLNSISLKSPVLSKCEPSLKFITGVGTGQYEMLRILCDNYRFASLVSDGRRMEIEYQQSPKIITTRRAKGFSIEYSMTSLVKSGSCGENREGTIQLAGDVAAFHSPNYPYYHPTNMTCRWDITVTAGQVIELTTRTYSLDKDCNKEWLRIYDGPSISSPVLTKLCYGYTHPLFSSTNRIIVEFVTLGTTRSKGFFAMYAARIAAPKPYACTGWWGKKINAASGKVASPRFPMRYSNNDRCWAIIEVPISYRVNLTFTTLDLEPDATCSKDSLTLSSDRWPLGKLCGKKKTPLSYTSKMNKIEFTFFADATGRYPGFEATFDSFRDTSFGNCTQQFKNNIIPMTSPSGIIFSPRYPAYYPPNMWCTWELEVPEGKLIRLSFDDVRLDKCSSSSIEIRDKASNKVISRLCDYPSTPHIIFSSGSGLVVQFKSSKDVHYRTGFTAHYDTIQHLPLSISCGQNSQIRKLEGSASGSIASYEYPVKYQNDVKCTWIIQTSSSYRFKIMFDFLDIEPSPGCKDDYVAIRDGGYSFSDVIGTFCGAKKPEPLTSSESSIFVEFKTNATGRYPGFKLSYEATYNVRTIVLISVFSVIGGIGAICLFAWIILKCCRTEEDGGVESVHLKSVE